MLLILKILQNVAVLRDVYFLLSPLAVATTVSTVPRSIWYNVQAWKETEYVEAQVARLTDKHNITRIRLMAHLARHKGGNRLTPAVIVVVIRQWRFELSLVVLLH